MTLELPTPGSLDPERDVIPRSEKHDVDYAPTWNWGGEFLGEGHRDLVSSLPRVNGLLYPQDVLKLYELAYLTPGPILEIGTFEGLSTYVMTRALRDAGSSSRLLSLDVSSASLAVARANLDRQGLGGHALLLEGTAGELIKAAPGFRPSLVFVDGDHSLIGVVNDLRAIRPIVPKGGIICFHDFEGYTHDDPYWTQVDRGIEMSWIADQCRFLGRFGISGVFQRMAGGPPRPADDPLIHENLKLRNAQTVKIRALKRARFNLERDDIPGFRLRRGLLYALARLRAS